MSQRKMSGSITPLGKCRTVVSGSVTSRRVMPSGAMSRKVMSGGEMSSSMKSWAR